MRLNVYRFAVAVYLYANKTGGAEKISNYFELPVEKINEAVKLFLSEGIIEETDGVLSFTESGHESFLVDMDKNWKTSDSLETRIRNRLVVFLVRGGKTYEEIEKIIEIL